ncbi:SURF1 family protein [Nocardioides sp.]|uniref:SURF1 family protein n=1 Tax=Nocardioides sp. TaxID=35761 RepID=UPI002ED63587
MTGAPGFRPWAPRWWPGHLLVLVLLGVAVFLGAWQFDVGQDERDSAARDLTRSDPVALTSVLGPDDPFPGDRVGQPVTVAGTWVPDATVYVSRDAGYWVVTPLTVDGSDAALPVVRGVSDTPDAEPVSGTAEVAGWLQPTEGTGAVDDDPADDVLPQLRVADLVQRVDQDLFSGYVVATEPTAGLAAATLEQLPEAGRLTGARNFFYALEWWIFGAFAVFVWVRYLLDVRQDRARAAGSVGSEA